MEPHRSAVLPAGKSRPAPVGRARRLALGVASLCSIGAGLVHLDVVDARPLRARFPRVAPPSPVVAPSATVATLAVRPVVGPAPSARSTMPPPASARAPYAFLRSSAVGPARWDPCAGPIRYAVNLASSGDADAARADVAEAFRRLSAATGLTFVDAGPSTWDGRDGDDPVTMGVEITIAWADAGIHPAFSDGVAGWTTDHWTQSATGRLVLQRATVLLRRDGSFGFSPDTPTGWGGLVLLHELGHAVGLEHVDDRGQLMSEELDRSSPADFGPGDRAGLARLGAGAGCNPRHG